MKPGDLVIAIDCSDTGLSMLWISQKPGHIKRTNPKTGAVKPGSVGLVLTDHHNDAFIDREVMCLFGEQLGWIDTRNVELVK